jgi:hypothetical protein
MKQLHKERRLYIEKERASFEEIRNTAIAFRNNLAKIRL